MMRFTSETEMPNVRAIVAGFSPALNDARMRFAFPSGISTTAWFQQAAILVRTRQAQKPRWFCLSKCSVFVSRSPLNRRLQPLKFRAFQIPQRGGEIAWQSDRRSRQYTSRCSTQSG
jgi:hypothetical protein